MGGYWQQFTKFYRRAGSVLDEEKGENFFPFTFDAAASEEYAELLDRPVATMPAIHVGGQEPRLRTRRSDGCITLAFLGHQRAEKGYDLVPSIIRRVRSRGVPVDILVHNGGPDCVATNLELRTLAAADPRLAFEEKPADLAYWQDLLNRSDLLVLPYDPTRYRASYSAVALEALGDGIPIVVPSGTTMETLVNTYQPGAVVFNRWTAEEVADAVEQSVQKFEQIASLAITGASEWRHANGASCFVDRLLEVLDARPEPISAKCGQYSTRDALVGSIYDLLFWLANTTRRTLKRLRESYWNRGGSHVITANIV